MTSPLITNARASPSSLALRAIFFLTQKQSAHQCLQNQIKASEDFAGSTKRGEENIRQNLPRVEELS